MPKTDKYVERQNTIGEYSPRISKENNALLSIYCRINNVNKGQYINSLIERDMKEKFEALKGK